jgi:hypothetical protein
MVGDLTAMSALIKPLLRLYDAIALIALAVLFGVVAVNVLGRAQEARACGRCEVGENRSTRRCGTC